MPQGADLEQLDGLGLNALGGVDDHDRRVGGHQGAVGILREVLVTGGIQDVDAFSVVFKLQHRTGNRDTTLFLDLHPVADRVAGALLALNAACLLDRAAVQQQLFGEGGLTGVRVADDRKGAPALDLLP